MTSQHTIFGSAVGLTVVGLVIMLFGVSLNNGAGPNAPIAAGGVVILAAFTLLAGGVIGLDDSETV